jgi:hypothetical protein
LVPRLHRYHETLRLPTDLLAALRFPSLGDTTPRRLCSSLHSGPTTAAWGLGPSGSAVPKGRVLSRWSRRASQVPGEPSCAYAVFLDPGQTDSARLFSGSTRPLVSANRGLLACGFSRGSIARLRHWLSTLRRMGLPTTTQDSLPAACQALPGGIGPPTGLLRKVSKVVVLTSLPPFPSFLAQADEIQIRPNCFDQDLICVEVSVICGPF